MDRSRVEDAGLVARVLAGDESAFAEMIERYADALSSIAYFRLRNAEDARDVVQQAFFAAYRDLPDLDDPAKFGGWVKGIALNLARKVVDKRARRQRFLERLPRPALAADPAEEAEMSEKARQVLRALDALDDARREVAELHLIHGMKVDEVAATVGRPVGSVKRMLAEARATLREELIGMAREDFREYGLSEEQRERLARIARFPRVEPKIVTVKLKGKAPQVRARSAYGSWPELRPGAEACFADYNHPGGKLEALNHARVGGPIEVQGKPALREDNMIFGREGKVEGFWRPCYRLVGKDSYLYCAKEWGEHGKGTALLTPDHPDWKEAVPKPISFAIVPGSRVEPEGENSGLIVDEHLYEVKIGKRSFRCVRRLGATTECKVSWSPTPVTHCATEEYYIEDGRVILWRRYNGMFWSEKNPSRKKDAPGTYERLAEAGMPMVEVFGHKFCLWYDQIPDYAIR